MNILYISALKGYAAAGPTYSVPNQISFQSLFDNVFWLNLTNVKVDMKDEANFNRITSPPSWIKLKDLPTPFNRPDLIVFEQFYVFGKYYNFCSNVIRSKIPYVIVPRCEFTSYAQKKKWLKKSLANKLIFYKFAQNANAIQYLTKNEKYESGIKWNNNSFIIPNGASVEKVNSERSHRQELNCSFIGRKDLYQKGIDLLLYACSNIKKELRNQNIRISIYGPKKGKNDERINKIIKTLHLEEIVLLKGEVYGEDKKRVLENTDVFILTSRFEGQPMGLVEALSYGIPCVVTEGTNMADVIEKYNAGWVAKTDECSIATAFLSMISGENLGLKSKNAYYLASQYNWENIALDTHNQYTEILDRINLRN